MENIIIRNNDKDKSNISLQMKEDLAAKPRHLIQVVNRRTGLSSDVIRVWEKRYQAVISHRNDTNRRLYSDKDIDKLTLLKRAIAAGRRIGDIAELSYDDLFELVMGDESTASIGYKRPSTGTIMELFDEAVSCIKEMNSWKLDNVLSNAVAILSTNDFLIEFIKPLSNYIQDECSRGSIRYSHEKMSKLCIRTCLNNLYLKIQFYHSLLQNLNEGHFVLFLSVYLCHQFYPTRKIRVPVNKKNVLENGIVKAENEDLILLCMIGFAANLSGSTQTLTLKSLRPPDLILPTFFTLEILTLIIQL